MSVQKQDGLHTDVGVSSGDLRGKEDLFCMRNSDGTISVATAGAVIAGVISEGRQANKHTSFNTRGNPILRVQAGAALARNTEVQSNGSGQAVSGSTNPFGRTRNAVGGSGEIVEVETYSTNTNS